MKRPDPGRRRTVAMALLASLAPALGGCAAPGYYAQAIGGQWEMWRAGRPIAEARADLELPAAVRERLVAAERIRDFASRSLALPDNGSYRRYADVKRPFAVWSVVAAGALSLAPKTWCFPFAGCVAYRGYFSEAAAREFAAELAAEGHDVFVAGVPAYSTLGWFDDPVLNTFVRYPDAELARLIFHELAHQVAYARDDSEFNESFAVAVEEAGVERWLAAHGDALQKAAFARMQGIRADFQALVARHRARLSDAYAAPAPEEGKHAAKARLLAALRADYQALRDGPWGGFPGYDRWLGDGVNNATLASIGLYQTLVPAFRALLARHDGELPRFYAAVRDLAALPREERRRALAAAGDGKT